jgi:putative inorganic carbon (HCO3(-)) transporter
MDKLTRLYNYSPTIVIILLTRASLDPLLNMSKVGGISLGALLNVFMLVVLFALFSHFRFQINKQNILWLPLLVIMFISIFYTPSPVLAIRSLLVAITYLAFFLLPFHFIRTKQDFTECVKIIIYSSIIPLMAVSYEFIFPEGSTGRNGFRLFSTFPHPNMFAFYLVNIVSICFFVVKSHLFTNDIRFRKLCWFVLISSLVCILGTKTRSAWVVVFLLVFIYGFYRERRYLVYLLLASMLAMLVPSIQDRVFDLFQGNDTDAFLDDYEALNSYAWRKIIWAGALEQFWERPILGFGYESFTHYSGSFFIIESDNLYGAHNTYVQLLFEIGFLGFLAFLWLLVPILLSLWEERRKARENIIVFGLFVSYCLIHYSDNVFDYLTFNWYFWFFIGSFLAYSKLKKQDRLKDL